MTESKSGPSYIPVFFPGRHTTRAGHTVLVEREEGGMLHGSLIGRQQLPLPVKLIWYRDGVRSPRGGLDPFDLVERVRDANNRDN